MGRAEIDQIVGELREAAALGLSAAARASELPPPGDAVNLVVDRPGVVRANVAAARQVLVETDRAVHGVQVGSAKLRGASIGAVMAILGGRILGQFDAFAATPRLLLVAPTIMAVERQLKVAPRDFRIWVALHEQTHRLQFAAAPWLRRLLTGQMNIIMAAEGESEGLWRALPDAVRRCGNRRPGQALSLSLASAFTSKEAAGALDRVTAVMSLLEGHADVMMDRAAPGVIASLAVIRRRFDDRRRGTPVTRLAQALIGMDAKMAQYADGARFCRQVIRRCGVPTLNLAFSEPEAMPTLNELHDPSAWMTRVSGG